MSSAVAQPEALFPSGLVRRALLATATAGGHLAAAGLLAFAIPNMRDAAVDTASIAIDLAEPAPTEPAVVPAPRPEPQRLRPVAAPDVFAVRAADPVRTPLAEIPVEPPAPAPAPEASVLAAAASSGAVARHEEAVSIPARFDADYLNNPKPVYPPYARRLGEQGKALLRVSVSPQGLPESVDVKVSSGSPRLDEAALEAVRRWRFVPARHGDVPVQSWVTVPVVFNLEG